MRILVLSGSPKREHSDTLCVTRAFPDGICSPMIPEEQYAAIVNGAV